MNTSQPRESLKVLVSLVPRPSHHPVFDRLQYVLSLPWFVDFSCSVCLLESRSVKHVTQWHYVKDGGHMQIMFFRFHHFYNLCVAFGWFKIVAHHANLSRPLTAKGRSEKEAFAMLTSPWYYTCRKYTGSRIPLYYKHSGSPLVSALEGLRCNVSITQTKHQCDSTAV